MTDSEGLYEELKSGLQISVLLSRSQGARIAQSSPLPHTKHWEMVPRRSPLRPSSPVAAI